MSNLEIFFTILIVGGCTLLTRALPFLIFRSDKPTPKFLVYLGKVLPAAIFGFLVIYVFKDVTVLEYPYGIPEAIALVVIVLLHLWRKNTLLSIGAGTVLYMILVQFVFVI